MSFNNRIVPVMLSFSAIIVFISLRTVWLMIGQPLSFYEGYHLCLLLVVVEVNKFLKRVSCIIILVFTGVLGILLKLNLFPRWRMNSSVDVNLGSTFLYLVVLSTFPYWLLSWYYHLRPLVSLFSFVYLLKDDIKKWFCIEIC